MPLFICVKIIMRCSIAMIEIKGLQKSFGDLMVLENIDLQINDGEIYGLVGRSGAGKSTLLRCINGLETYTEGSIKVDNTEVKDLSVKEMRDFRKNVSMIFQHFPMLSRKTVYENIAFPMRCWKYDKKVILSILVDTFISKISLTMQPGPKIDSISGA